MEPIIGKNNAKEGDWRNADFLTFEESADADVDDDGADDNNNNNQDEVEGEDESIEGSNENQDDSTLVNGILLPPWMTVAASPRINPLIRLHNEIVDFCTLMQPKPHELQQREGIGHKVSRPGTFLFWE